MKKLYVFATLICALNAAYIGQATAKVPAIESKGVAALTTCPTAAPGKTLKPKSYHSDKVVFKIVPPSPTVPFTAALPADQAKLDAIPRNTELDIKIRDNTAAVANIISKVLSFLGASITPSNAAFIKIISVEYATAVCPKSP